MVLAVSSGERVGPFRDNTLPITFTCDDAEQFATTLLQLKSTALDGRPRRGNDNYARLVPLLFLQERGHHRGESVAATFAPQHRRASCRGTISSRPTSWCSAKDRRTSGRWTQSDFTVIEEGRSLTEARWLVSTAAKGGEGP